MEPQPGSPTSPPFSPTLWDNNARAATPSDGTKEEATELEPGRKSSASSSSSSSALSADIPFDIDAADLVNPLAAAVPEDERAGPPVHGAEAKPADGQAAPAVTVHSAEANPDDWVTWSEPPSLRGGGAAAAPTEAPPPVQTVSPDNLGAAGVGAGGFDPGRIPASVFQHRATVSQAEWSVTSNESLFSIQGASDMFPSRSQFDFYYDEAMAESKLPSLEEVAEPGDTPQSSGSGDWATNAKRAARFRSGSGSSSSNFSFAFPILAETSPRKKDLVSSALYQPLEDGQQQSQPPSPLEPPVSAFMEMTTEEERRRNDDGCCCCGCCWFDCSWCSRWCCPSFCRCSWCLCS